MAKGGNVKYSDIVNIVMETRTLLENFEQKSVGKKWGNEELLIGLMTDIGDLARLILAKEGFRSAKKDLEKQLRHEIAACFWAIVVLSEKYKVNIPQALQEMSIDLKKKLKKFNE